MDRRKQPASASDTWSLDAGAEDSRRRRCTRTGRPSGSARRSTAAGILTLAHGLRVVYKYGGSNARLNALGGMPFLFWRAIEDAKRAGVVELDLGRSDRDNAASSPSRSIWPPSAPRSPTGAPLETRTRPRTPAGRWRSPAACSRACRARYAAPRADSSIPMWASAVRRRRPKLPHLAVTGGNVSATGPRVRFPIQRLPRHR
ncbi:MAG: GNAT family N-acetyltransferase [Candidatus Rokuibacteriota bacterium]